MTEAVTIARPYAVAVYRLAKEQGAVDRWFEVLRFLSLVVSDPDFQTVSSNPKISVEGKVNFIKQLGLERLDEQATNLIRLLGENRRIDLLPQISEIFESLKDQDNAVVEAELTFSAQPDAQLVGELLNQLASRFRKKIESKIVIDPHIIGGVKIVIGDTVIDASVRARLQEMAYTLKA